MEKEYYLRLEGKKIKVSREVYLEYKRYQDKERYFMERLKKGREVSISQLQENGQDISDQDMDVENAVIRNCMLRNLEEALHTLTDEELELIRELFYLEKTEREVCSVFGMAKSTLHNKKKRILKKLRETMEKI